MKSQITRKLVKTLILIGFVYQLYDITHEYLRFTYSIEVNVKPVFAVIPSVTICVDQRHEIKSSKTFTITTNPYNRTIFCLYHDSSRNGFYSCDDFDAQTFIRYKKNSICLTYLNQDKYIETKILVLAAALYNRAEFIFHPPYTPSHFERSNKFVIKMESMSEQKGADIKVKKFVQILLPFPYSTNCFDYSVNRRNNIWPKSQTDCKLEYMRRKELHECRHNFYWNQHLFDNNPQILDFNHTIQTNCSVKVDHDMLDKNCKKDCYNSEISVTSDKYTTKFHGSLAFYGRRQNNFIHSTYFAKLDLVTYFSTVGGLISIYLGHCIYTITSIIFKSALLICDIFIILKKKRIFTQIKRLIIAIKLTSNLIFLGVILYQLNDISTKFLRFNEKAVISFRDNYRLPRIDLMLEPRMNYVKLEEKYPDIHKKILSEVKSNYLTNIHLIDFLIKNISEMKYLTNFDEINLNCMIKFSNYEIKCPEPVEIIRTFPIMKISVGYQFFSNNINYNNTPISFSIEISGNIYITVLSIFFSSGSILEYNHEKHFLNKIIQPFHINNLVLNQKFASRFSKKNEICIDRKQGEIIETEKDELILDCLNQNLNQTFGCLPVFGVSSWIRLERDLNQFQYEICPKNITNDPSLVNSTLHTCSAKINPFCETQLFEVFNNYKEYNKPFSTKINIIPKNNLMPEFKQKYRMNFMDWIYNCGGIIGLWFGWSALSVAALPQLIIQHCKLIKIYYHNFKLYLIIRKKRKSVNYHFITINNFQVIVYHKPHNFVSNLTFLDNKCGKFVLMLLSPICKK